MALTAASTAAVLGLTNVSAKTIAITAQGFGLTGGAWTIFADSYLFKLSPTIIFDIEDKLQQAYRASALKSRKDINNGAAAYQYIRGYLSLCLPVSIENKVNSYLTQTTAGNKPGSGNGGTPPPSVSSQSALAPKTTASGTTPQIELKSAK